MLRSFKVAMLAVATITADICCAAQTQQLPTGYATNGEFMLEMTDETIGKAMNELDYLLLYMYAPTCETCQTAKPELEKAAQQLLQNDPPVYVAAVNGVNCKEIVEALALKGVPTVYFLK